MKLYQKALLLSLAIAMLLLAGCSSKPTPPSDNKTPPSSDVTPQTPPTDSKQPETNSKPETPSDSDKPNGTDEEVVPLSENWDDLDVRLDGVVYKYPYVYQDFDNAGWILEDKTERGLPDGARMTGYRPMPNQQYALGDKHTCYLYCGFFNPGSEFAEMVDCKLWCLEYSIASNLPEDAKTADLELAKGIHIGSTEEEILAAYGPYTKKADKQNPSPEEAGSVVLVYEKQKDDGRHLMELSLRDGKLYKVYLSVTR